MKKAVSRVRPGTSGDLLPEYRFDYSKSKPNRFASHFKGDAVAVVLAPDVSEVFPTSESVNEALRLLTKVARKRVRVASRSATTKGRRSSKGMRPTKRTRGPRT
jgi:hypothetical protein